MELALAPLNRPEAELMAGRVCGRYHRHAPGEAVRELLAKQTPDDQPAAGSPLCNNFNFDLHDALENEARLGVRLRLLEATRAALQRLAAADPSNALWQRDLWVSCWRMALMAEQSGTGDALDWWRKAYETLSAMKKRGIMLPTDEQYLVQLRQKISGP